jgi:transketolase
MRQAFAQQLKEKMKQDSRIWVVLGGVGYGLWEEGGQVINCEASEVAAVDIAVGLALEGMIPFVYCITPHLYRAFEQTRNYLDHESIPVKLVGVGRGRSYGNLGFSHWAEDVERVFGLFPNIKQYYPEKLNIQSMVDEVVSNNLPCFISLDRF